MATLLPAVVWEWLRTELNEERDFNALQSFQLQTSSSSAPVIVPHSQPPHIFTSIFLFLSSTLSLLLPTLCCCSLDSFATEAAGWLGALLCPWFDSSVLLRSRCIVKSCSTRKLKPLQMTSFNLVLAPHQHSSSNVPHSPSPTRRWQKMHTLGKFCSFFLPLDVSLVSLRFLTPSRPSVGHLIFYYISFHWRSPAPVSCHSSKVTRF